MIESLELGQSVTRRYQLVAFQREGVQIRDHELLEMRERIIQTGDIPKGLKAIYKEIDGINYQPIEVDQTLRRIGIPDICSLVDRPRLMIAAKPSTRSPFCNY